MLSYWNLMLQVDPSLRLQLEWLLRNPVDHLGLFFTYAYEARGRRHEEILFPATTRTSNAAIITANMSLNSNPPSSHGSDALAVTEENKIEFVQMMAAARTVRPACQWMHAVREGLRVGLPADTCSLLQVEDLALVCYVFTCIIVLQLLPRSSILYYLHQPATRHFFDR
jgi:hypothetical protein